MRLKFQGRALGQQLDRNQLLRLRGPRPTLIIPTDRQLLVRVARPFT